MVPAPLMMAATFVPWSVMPVITSFVAIVTITPVVATIPLIVVAAVGRRDVAAVAVTAYAAFMTAAIAMMLSHRDRRRHGRKRGSAKYHQKFHSTSPGHRKAQRSQFEERQLNSR
ncbi:MAG: hypothetical protein CMK08_15630 [Ponticaulis sp.]|jgi:glycerol-3-phosphate acyltransferase PlsY|nr:hypothetical protein [Ponticaulis sp.]PHR75966.1 MAG: hypothetical protein COA64_11455 [Henriciella sp.]|tara:strand:+ start:14899 stop:15243 length:345 start_codon:yes stop_codon:yes gene_type:complete